MRKLVKVVISRTRGLVCSLIVSVDWKEGTRYYSATVVRRRTLWNSFVLIWNDLIDTPFFDKLRSSLPITEKFLNLIFDAIEQCQVGVVVLSESFTRSKWPMLELNAMVKAYEKPNSRMKIIPVFYRISLVDFKASENWMQWLLVWEVWAVIDKSGRMDVGEWKKAMRTLESINRLVMKEAMGNVKFQGEIFEEICRMIPPKTRWDDSHVQGRHHSLKVICDKMDEVISSLGGVCVVGLYGVGGIGKSTICKALCNELSLRFHDNVCHVELGQGNENEVIEERIEEAYHDKP